MIQEVRQAMLVQKLRYGAEAMTWSRALSWATAGSAACLGRPDLGAIEVGRQADLALFRLDEPRFSGAGDPLAALLLCGATRADAVMVAGVWRVRDGAISGLDLDALMAHHGEAARRLLARAESAVPRF
jgi:8-oxoguanine deaminase